MKTLEELVQVYINNLAIYKSESPLDRSCFIAGYKAAQEHTHVALEKAEAKIRELRDQLMEESGGRLKLFKDDADAKAAYLEALEDTDSWDHILDATKMVDVNGWISVKDRLPDFEVLCVWVDVRRIAVDGLGARGVGDCEPWEEDYTHWMPLPEPPKEEE